ncbi:GAF domain-containing SpoIIE family protein phosphatase [Streptomyces sp. NPDC095613]|uniref:PP2C family protein-serine/threonine phosphatase n=1 Tax=Streptomyces sp. NPDC095613 TaxID=3155540 RepID=UPI00331CC6F7
MWEVAVSDEDGARAGVAARLRLMERAPELIGTTLDRVTTAQELAQFLCPGLCDAVAVDLLPDDAPAHRPPPAALLERVAQAGKPDLVDACGPAGDRAGQQADTAWARAPAEGRAATVPTAADGAPPTALRVPLLAHGRVHGALLAVRESERFTDDETAAMAFVARLAAVHLGHAGRHSAVRDTAQNLQRALLAEPGRPHPNLELATRYLPAGGGALVGGDWCESVRLHYGRTLLVVGDVMGHGLDAAVDMSAYRSALRYIASTDLPPHRVLRQVDAAVAESDTRRPATCLLVRMDPVRGKASVAAAGHLPPVVFSGDGTTRVLPVSVGPPLGTGLGGYELTTHTITPAETLLMFTDGLVERRDEDIDVSLRRLAAHRLPPGAPVEDVLDRILGLVDHHRAEDDVALLVARIRPRPGRPGHPADLA